MELKLAEGTMRYSKTNAVRLLERAGVPHTLHPYQVDPHTLSAVNVAGILGVSPERLFKTLVTKASTDEYLIFVIPGSATLDFRKAERATVQRQIKMVPHSDLMAVTGYIHGGCSPISMKRPLATWIDKSALAYDTILVSGGRQGLQVELSAEDLGRLSDAVFADLIKRG